MKSTIDLKTILKFYRIINFHGFDEITDERREELDEIVLKNKRFFISQATCRQALMTFLASKMITSSKNYGLKNGAEQAYFFINVLDPELQVLAVYEAANTQEEIKDLNLKNFYIYDKFLIALEKSYNVRFQKYQEDELWSRENIIR